MTGADTLEERVVILAPIGRDAAAIAEVCQRVGLASLVCRDLAALLEALRAGAGAAMIAEEALYGGKRQDLLNWVESQPPWSDLPFVILTSRQTRPEVATWRRKLLEGLRNASFIERPLDALGLSSSAETAVRGRRKQYEVREYVAERASAAATLERLVAERTRELEAANAALRMEMEQRREVEDALRQSQKMEAVGQLTGGLAHDFNNLLTGIMGALEMIKTRLAQGRAADVDRYISAARGGTTRAASLTHRLLAFSRRQTLDPKPTDVNGLVRGMEELIRRTIGPAISLDIVADDDLWPILVDPNQLENALLNLCINARDAMPDGGRLMIATENFSLGAQAARALDVIQGDYVALSVADTGQGMTPDVIANAFDPFFTTKPIGQGTGLGLSMVYGFARQSGGHARIMSEIGHGATIRICLPRHVDEYAGADTSPAPDDALVEATGEHIGERVLVVDDEPLIRLLLTEALEEHGFETLGAADGVEALRSLQAAGRIDLLVTDVGLPGGMNGRQLADAGRVIRPNLKVLFITGYAENAVLRQGHLDDGMHVITKPFAIEALVERIGRVMAEHA